MSSIARRFALAAAGLIAALGLAACATSDGNGPSKQEMMTAAGFKMKIADTPAKQASLAQLPQHKFIHRQLKDKMLTIWADAAGCKCLYVGDQAAWQAYAQERLAKHLVEENENAAAMDDESAMMSEQAAAMNSMDWGAWGAEGWGWGPY
jgi:hypothetical protein